MIRKVDATTGHQTYRIAERFFLVKRLGLYMFILSDLVQRKKEQQQVAAMQRERCSRDES